MERIEIEGGRRLEGELSVSGAKNAALPLMVSSLLCEEPLLLRNVPAVSDVFTLLRVLRELGVSAVFHDAEGGKGSCSLCAEQVSSLIASRDSVSRMRAGFWVLGPLLARYGEGRVPLPGGCAIGARPVDLYLKALKSLGARLHVDDGYVVARAPHGLTGSHISFSKVTVGATHTLLMAGVLAKGRTTIENAAREPEIVDLIACLNKMGAKITGAGTSRLVIEGVERLYGTVHGVIPDRIEAGTYAMAVLAAGGEVFLSGARSDHLESVLDVLRDMGGEFAISSRGVRVCRGSRRLRPTTVQTASFPGFPTDLQAQLMALTTLSDGVSVLHETIFENRFMHVQELIRLGADISLEGERAVVRGPTPLKGSKVTATDLRAAAGLIIAGLAGEGITTIVQLDHLDRGFESIEEKLTSVGAKIVRRS